MQLCSPDSQVKTETLNSAYSIARNGPDQVDTLTQATVSFLTVQLRWTL